MDPLLWEQQKIPGQVGKECLLHRKVGIIHSHESLNTPNISMFENKMSAYLHSASDTVPSINLPWNLFCCFDNKIIS